MSPEGTRLVYLARQGSIADIRSFRCENSVYSTELNLALWTAAERGRLAIVKLLIDECGADPLSAEGMALCRAALEGHMAVVSYFVEDLDLKYDGIGDGPLRWAATEGQWEVVRYLLQAFYPAVAPACRAGS